MSHPPLFHNPSSSAVRDPIARFGYNASPAIGVPLQSVGKTRDAHRPASKGSVLQNRGLRPHPHRGMIPLDPQDWKIPSGLADPPGLDVTGLQCNR